MIRSGIFKIQLMSDRISPSTSIQPHDLSIYQDFIVGAAKDDDVVLNVDKKDVIATDTILVVGYDLDTFFIKTKWSNKILKIENCFIKNIKELWNIELYPFY